MKFTSITRKIIMSLLGLFLVVFLTVHLGVNLLLLSSDPDLFNTASHFMATNPVIQVMQYVLALGFILHIVFGIILWLQNNAARPKGYVKNNAGANSSLESRTMIYTGALILLFLIIHMRNFFVVIKFGEVPPGGDYVLVTELFGIWYYTMLYVVAFILLGLHLNHGFQSAFQSVGLNNKTWTPVWKIIGTFYSVIIAGGFSLIALYHFFV
ncbi:MAG: succinate dehydrogenase [Bacteroidetes bacterium]|nr:MAG: succinate dehydrogenase [Bacteroidota bacterium]